MPEVFPTLPRLLRHGYVVAAAAVRGSGASSGRYEGLFSEAETQDAVELIEWFAEQPFCDGNIGMFGGSYLGITQYMAASKAPEALKAIFPDVAALDMYETIHPGAVFRKDMLAHWAGLTAQLDRSIPPAPVDDDTDKALMAAAITDHADNWEVMSEYSAGPFRDHDVPSLSWREHGPIGYLEEINAAGVPIYHSNGWFDVFAMDAVLWFANYEGPQRLVMGDWSHAQLTPERIRITSAEQHRWFDRWLKGVENGVEDEAPIQYALMDEPGQMSWRSAQAWPPAGARKHTLYFTAAPSGSVASTNDGGLAGEAPAGDDVHEYAVDATTTTGSSSRWDNAVGAAPAMAYRGLAENDAKCLTYTTAPLEEDVSLVGHPVVVLWITASQGDAKLHVLLEEVAADGDVRYVTEGVLRASQRKLADAPYDNLGLPYQRCFAEDAEPVPGDTPVEVVMDLQPTANVFNAGHRLRIAIMGADADNTEPSALEDNTLRLFVGGAHPSRLELTVLDE